MKFSEYSLNSKLQESLEVNSIDTPSPIQEQVFSAILEGRDVMGISQTGTGKTLAYLLPVIQNNLDQSKPGDILILEPTRELVQQVHQVSTELLEKLDITTVKICGGETLVYPETTQNKLITATPGRLLKALAEDELNLSSVKSVIIDEADQFFQQGFFDVLQELLSGLISEHQSLMFSATMPASLEKFSKQFMIHPKVVNLIVKEQMVLKIKHRFQLLMPNQKLDILKEHLADFSETQVLIFCNTKFIAERLHKQLQFSEEDMDWLHGDLEQDERVEVFNRFRKGDFKILVTTDVAARGLDIQNLDLVVNYDFPINKEAFIHRAGRTGRMGRAGTMISFVRIEELKDCQITLRDLKLKPEWIGPVPDFSEINPMKYKSKKKHKGPASPRNRRRK